MAVATLEPDAVVDDVHHVESAGRLDGHADAAQKLSELHAALDVLARADLDGCGHDELDVLRGATHRLRSFAAAADSRIARRRERLWAGDGGTGTGDDAATGEPGAATGAPAPDAAPETGADGTGGHGLGNGIGDAGGGQIGAAAIGDARDRRSHTDAARDYERARAGDQMTSFEAALAAGEIDVAHVDAVAAALRRLTDDDTRAKFVHYESMLLAAARSEQPDRFRRRCNHLVRQLLPDHGVAEAERRREASTVRTWHNAKTGMGHLHLELDPERYARVTTVIDAKLNELRAREPNSGRSLESLRVDAVVDLITTPGSGVGITELVVLVDHETLRTGRLSENSIAETTSGIPITPAAIGQMACDAAIIGLTVDHDGLPLDVGRSQRLATRKQRLALSSMYATCAHPGCNRPVTWSRIHHVRWWEHGGPTDIDNLLPLCDFHHHQVHEGGWTLTMTPDRVCTWITPNGTIWYSGDTRDRQPDPPPRRSRAAIVSSTGGIGV